MNEEDARRVLGATRAATWDEIRALHRRAIRSAHPDVAGGSDRSAAQINQAFDILRVQWKGAVGPNDGPGQAGPNRDGTQLINDDVDRIELIADPPADLFDRLLAACDEVGNVTGYDRGGAIISALVGDAPHVGQLVVTLGLAPAESGDQTGGQTGDQTIAFTLDSFGHEAAPPIADFADAILQIVIRPAR